MKSAFYRLTVSFRYLLNDRVEQLTSDEHQLLRSLSTPWKIQKYLDSLHYNKEPDGETCRSPRRTIRDQTAHCFEGALLAAAAMGINGRPALILDLESFGMTITLSFHSRSIAAGALSRNPITQVLASGSLSIEACANW
jgi:hypothetical protein